MIGHPIARSSASPSSATTRVTAALVRCARAAVNAPAQALLVLIRVYQKTLSPALPAFFGASCGCRFAPTCSHYAAEAIRTHGAMAGTALALLRLLKCTPLHPGGFDPVPPRRTPRCARAGA